MSSISDTLSSNNQLDNLSTNYILHKRVIEYNKQFANQGYQQPYVTLYYQDTPTSFAYLEGTNMYVPAKFQNGSGFIVQGDDGIMYLYLVPQQPFANVSGTHTNQQYLGYQVNLDKPNQIVDNHNHVWTTNLTVPNLFFANANKPDGSDMEIKVTADLNSLYLGYSVSSSSQSKNSKDYTWIPTPDKFPTLDILYADNTDSLVIDMTNGVVLNENQKNSIDIVNQVNYE